MKTLFTAEAVSKGGRSGTIKTPDGMPIVILGNPLERAEVGKVSAKGKEEIDAKGKLVTPGFVDIHTHYDGQATWSHGCRPRRGTASPPRSWAIAASASRPAARATASG